MCACYPGYTGDRFNCTGMHLISYPANIDNTENLHSCLEQWGKRCYFSSRIISLFVSSAKLLDINECSTYPCHGNATCNNTIGSYMCACDTGYSGDGFNCSGMYNWF